jgi:hypothetical protein
MDEEEVNGMEDPLQEGESGEEDNKQSEWEYGDCDIDSNVDYSELLCEDNFDNDADGIECAENVTTAASERNVLSPVMPGVNHRHSIYRKSFLGGTTRRISFLPPAQPIFLTDTQEEVDATEMVMLPGEDEVEFSRLSCSAKKNHRSKRQSSILVRRQSNFGEPHSLLRPKNRRNSQTRLSWMMPSLIAADESSASHSATDAANIVPQSFSKMQYHLSDDQENHQQANNRSGCVPSLTEKGWKKVSDVAVEDRWLKGVKCPLGSSGMQRERDAEMSRRRASLNKIVSIDLCSVNIPTRFAAREVNLLRPALRLPSPCSK